MLRWLLSWFVETRLIFVFHDGQRRRRCDPWQAALATYSIPGFDPYALLSRINADELNADVLSAAAELSRHVRTIFSIRQLADGGLTDGECVQVMREFLVMIGDVKKNTSTSPTVAPSTASDSPTTYSLDNPPMPFDSDSGPMLNGKPCDPATLTHLGLTPVV